MKTCRRCGQAKPADDFRPDLRNRDGLQSWCRACMSAYTGEWSKRNPGRRNATARARYAADPERHIQTARRSRVKRQYGLTLEEYGAILERGCAICGAHDPRMALDHNHANGKIRDALCGNCNNGLGRFQDDPDRLRMAASYLEKHHH